MVKTGPAIDIVSALLCSYFSIFETKPSVMKHFISRIRPSYLTKESATVIFYIILLALAILYFIAYANTALKLLEQ